jgi:hypothetical protein
MHISDDDEPVDVAAAEAITTQARRSTCPI